MLNYNNMYRSLICERLNKYKTDRDLPVWKMARDSIIGGSTLEHLMRYDAKRSILSAPTIEALCSYTKWSANELIWGNDNEQETFIKILLLALLLNGSNTNPFRPFRSEAESEQKKRVHKKEREEYQIRKAKNLFKWARQQKGLNDELRGWAIIGERLAEDPSAMPIPEGVDKIEFILSKEKEIANAMKSLDTFFFSDQNYETYERLRGSYDPQLDRVSHLILRQMLHDFDFTSEFIDRLKCYNMGMSYREADKHINYIKDFVNMKGSVGDIILDYKGPSYYLFINSFNKLWEKRKIKYIEYFNEKFFWGEKMVEKGISQFNDAYFQEVLTSPDFIQIIEYEDTWDTYADTEAILSENYLRFAIQESIQKEYLLQGNETDQIMDLWEYCSQNILETRRYAKKLLHDESEDPT